MFFKIFSHGEKYLLVIQPGVTKVLNLEEVKELVFAYDTITAEDTNSYVEDLVDTFQGSPLVTMSDDRILSFHDVAFLRLLATPTEFPYLTIDEYAAKHNKKRSIVYKRCTDEEKRKELGAVQSGSTWYIPKYTPYPKDGRAGRKMPKRKKDSDN